MEIVDLLHEENKYRISSFRNVLQAFFQDFKSYQMGCHCSLVLKQKLLLCRYTHQKMSCPSKANKKCIQTVFVKLKKLILEGR